jgi:hypothetical protein
MAEDQLPSELLLRCDVKQMLFSDLEKKSNEKSYTRDLQLKDGVFTWVGNPDPIGNGCKLSDGEIACEWSGVLPTYISGAGPITPKRHSSVRFSRATGEIHVSVEMWDYAGKRAEGTPTSHSKVTMSGLCRTIG